MPNIFQGKQYTNLIINPRLFIDIVKNVVDEYTYRRITEIRDEQVIF